MLNWRFVFFNVILEHVLSTTLSTILGIMTNMKPILTYTNIRKKKNTWKIWLKKWNYSMKRKKVAWGLLRSTFISCAHPAIPNSQTHLFDDKRYKIGESFMTISLEEANERLEKERTKVSAKMNELKSQMTDAKTKMEKLKMNLYSKFGKAINLDYWNLWY